MFPLRTWYVAARSDEIPADRPLGRRICGQPMAFFRSADGRVAAVEDFCPHRGAPLSLGRVEGSSLVCGYHGLAMGADGRTVAMPCQRVRGFPAIRSYPVVEAHGFVWVWPGEVARAEGTAPPAFEWLGNPDFGYGGGLYHIACDYRLMIDNLMDLTHETYVHASSIGQKEIDEAPPRTRVEGDHVIVERHMSGVKAPPFWQMALRLCGLPDDQPVDRWQICHFTPPSHVMIEVGVALQGHGGHAAPDAVKAASWVVDFITPETETSIHYFWGMARRFRPHDESVTEQIRTGQGAVFAEDQQMLERQQANLLAHPGRGLLMLNIDGGGVQSRKVVERWLAREAQGMSAVLQARVATLRPVAEGIVELTLEPLPGQPLPAFEAGAHADLHLPGGLVRPYSLCNDPAERHRYVFGVLREPASRGGSRAVHEALAAGQVLALGAPRNNFHLHAGPAPALLLAGGIGVTPLLGMARQLRREGRRFALHYAGRTRARMAFLPEMQHEQLLVPEHLHVDDERAAMDLPALLAAQPADAELYVCGPAGFMDAVDTAARALGWPSTRLHRERFTAAPQAAPAGGDRAFEIHVAGTGQVVAVPVGRTAAAAMQAAGLPLLTSCEQGVCGTCLTRVLDGEPEHRDQYLTPEEQAAGDQFLPCCSRARGPRLVVQL